MIAGMLIDYDTYYAPNPSGERWEGWRELGARGKADHIMALLGQVGAEPEAVLEVGCGDGAVLAELARRRSWVGSWFAAVRPYGEVAASGRHRRCSCRLRRTPGQRQCGCR